MEKVFETAKLPLARVPVRATYSANDLAGIFQAALKRQASATQETPQVEKSPGSIPICPKCGIPMVQRTAKRGNTPGQTFWGCANYPRCREMVANTSNASG